jgi:GMP synthase-like glutamine amidotransferase
MKPVLVLENHVPEHLAYLGTWLTKNNIDYVVFNADIDKEFPTSVEPYSALAVMGGAMSANDPLLSNRQAEILILQAMYRDIPVIGHCLGGQLMSKALGGTITTSPKPEIGWQHIDYVDNDLTKAWFGENPTDAVIQWHYDTFSIPSGATLLASSPACPNQAFAIGKHLAMQFHIEIDREKVATWVNDDDAKWIESRQAYDTVQDAQTMVNEAEIYLQKHQQTADNIYKHWLSTTEWIDKL